MTTASTTVVDDAAPLTSSSLESRSGPNRVSFGTMLGHEMHGVQARVAVAVTEADIGVRGTAHGRDVHLAAAHPAMAVEPETLPAAAISSPSLGVPAGAQAEPAAASTSSGKFAPARDSLNEFSGGDHRFFATEPINDEYEPENPRGRLYTRLAVSGAVVAVVSVVVVAWVNSHGSSGEEPPPIEVKSQPAVTAPVPVRTAVTAPAPAPPVRAAEVPPTSTIPSSVPERIAVTTPPPRYGQSCRRDTVARAARSRATAPPGPGRRRRGQAHALRRGARAVPAPIGRRARAQAWARSRPRRAPRQGRPGGCRGRGRCASCTATPPPPPPQKKTTAVATAAPRPPATPPPRAATPPPPPVPAARPAAPVAKAPSPPSHPVAKSTPARASKPPARSKQKYDPDGTLPLSFE